MGFQLPNLSGRRSFANELREILPAHIAALGDLDAAVGALDHLPYEWWSRAKQIAITALRRGGIQGFQERLFKTLQWCKYVPALGLHMRSSLAQLRRAYYAHPELHSRLPSLGRLIKFHTRSIECVGQELMIHRLKGQERVTALGKDAWRHHETHIANVLRNARVGIFQRSMMAKAAASERASIGSFHARAHGSITWAVSDLGYVCRRWFITCPQAFHACHVGGDINPAWISLGRPSPARANNFLRTLLSITRRKCQRLGLTPIGPKTVEAHESGTPHINLILAFASDADANAFDAALRAAYAHVAARYGRLLRQPGGFAVTQQSIVSQAVTNIGEAVSYALKNVLPNESASVLPHDDRSWCKLWGNPTI
ncbi:replication endonuclease [Bordetella sp. 02P26C-1]|uniref:replication endonuclease n=1 Tax=Bordetella sp. 02P26C-1 TaxID=2683195 RepID=UPI001355616F|nr:replication endonuclease [Bordetella sp. 02P26C-1]MVW80111.1 hypothetical protein [Bordetella sp. 02P26C-1]